MKKNKITLIVLASVVGFYFFLMGLQAFFDNYRFRFQFPLRTPLWIEKIKKEPVDKVKKKSQLKITPSPAKKKTQVQLSEKEIVYSFKHGEVLWRVYGLESSWGKNDYCRLNGKGYGGFGVLDNGKIVCYKTFKTAVERAQYWLIKNGIEKDLVNGLCSYNLGPLKNGKKHVNCLYYQNYLLVL